MNPKPNWPALKAAYLAGDGSLRDLAATHHVSFHTLAKRCRREDWTGELATLSDAVATAVAKTATEVATRRDQEIGLSAAELVARTVGLTGAMLDEVEGLLAAGQLTVAEFRHLTAAWRDVVATGRQALRLDAPPEPTPTWAKAIDV